MKTLTAICSVEGCDSEARARGWCMKHYHKARRAGLPLVRIPGRVCIVDGCDRKHHAHGYCQLHANRVTRHGDADHIEFIVGDDHRRLLSYVPKVPRWMCWEWQGYRDANGYGKFTIQGSSRGAYRVLYEATFGPIEDGLHLDHLCRNTSCVNPWHLEPVTSGVNALRGVGPTAVNARKTHCKRGHAFTPENTYIIPSSGSRQCRTCKREMR